MVHLFPGFVAVLDEGDLEREESISLRWHTISEAIVSRSGTFSFESNETRMVGCIEILDGTLEGHKNRRHSYEAPYHRDRTGDLLEQRREPYIESVLNGKRYRALTLFALAGDKLVDQQWVRDGETWSFEMADDRCEVTLLTNALTAHCPVTGRAFEVSL